MSYHWILIADASRARVLSADELFGDLQVVSELVHPASRLHTSELMSDDRGRVRTYGGSAGTAYEPNSDPAENEHAAFSREVADALLAGLDAHSYQQLVIAAPPRFLGMLRDDLSPRVAAKVTVEINHDYTKTPLHELPALLKKNLPG